MILPMKKVSLVVLDKHREKSLEKLREVGVIHIEKKSVSSDALAKLLDRKAKVDNALRVLQPYLKLANEKGKKIKAQSEVAASTEDPDLVGRILDSSETRKNLKNQLLMLARERSRISEWGDFDPKDIPFLAENAQLNIFLYKLMIKDFEKLPENIRYIRLGGDGKFLRLLVLDQELPGKDPFHPGEYSQREIDSIVSGINGELAEIDRKLNALTSEIAQIEDEANVLKKGIEFESARAGMDVLEDVPEESNVAWLSGFVPQEDMGLLKRAATENSWGLMVDDPAPNDFVPTKLKNNRFANLLTPLTGFLNVTPGYREVDISGWFLLFFSIYFGMIFGDAFYGGLFVIAAIIGILKTRKKGVPQVLKLVLLLGTSNFLWGLLTCNWFGVDVNMLPPILHQISVPAISNVTAARSDFYAGIVQQNLMILCFSLALMHLSIGHIIAITQKRGLKILAELGSIAMLAGMYGLVLHLIASNESRQIPLFEPCIHMLGGGFVVNFIFANYEGSVGRSILEGLKNFISMVLGIANVFSDIMSYIRLWAVGLAGSAIASTVNEMAGPMLGSFIFFVFGVILLVSGHGLNIVLNGLSVLVHGVRLNTLEFSSHVGLEWKGTPYKPFSQAGMKGARETAGKSGS